MNLLPWDQDIFSCCRNFCQNYATSTFKNGKKCIFSNTWWIRGKQTNLWWKIPPKCLVGFLYLLPGLDGKFCVAEISAPKYICLKNQKSHFFPLKTSFLGSIHFATPKYVQKFLQNFLKICFLKKMFWCKSKAFSKTIWVKKKDFSFFFEIFVIIYFCCKKNAGCNYAFWARYCITENRIKEPKNGTLGTCSIYTSFLPRNRDC